MQTAFNYDCTPRHVHLCAFNASRYTGKERDSETNNDDFGARYYSSAFGRWTSPDWSAIPAPVPYANLTNPQTLNLYAMVRDNPETFVDLDGHCPQCVEEVEEEAPEALSAAEQYSPELRQFDAAVSESFAPIDNAITTASNRIGDWIVGGLAAALSALKGDKSPAVKPGNAQAEEKTPAEPQAASGGKGTIYKVPGSGTNNGKPYIGRHNKPNPAKTRKSNDGRDRTKAKVIDTYNASNTQEGRQKEQQQIDQHGGIQNLDNKRNEIHKDPPAQQPQ